MHKRQRALFAACASVLALAASATAAPPEESLYLSIAAGADSTTPRSIVLPLGKAVVIDLPTEARDVLLSSPTVADSVVRTARRVFIIGRAVGQTNAFFFDASGRQIANLEIRVEPDMNPLNAMFKRFAPNASVKAEAVNGAVVLSGTVKSAAEADKVFQLAQRFGAVVDATGKDVPARVVNLLAVEGKEQVLVKVRVVEMSRSLIKQLGVNVNAEDILNKMLPEDMFFDLATSQGYSVNGKLLGGLSGTYGVAESVLQPSSLTYPTGTATPADLAAAGVGGYSRKAIFDAAGNVIGYETIYGPATSTVTNKADVSIQAFERAGLLRVLAEPNLTAISGEAAKFLAGGEFPVPVRAEDNEITVEFKPFGVGLAFTPVVMSGGRISLKLSTEVSELTSEGSVVVSGINLPALQVRRAETTVEMPSGGSLMMAGLIQERTRQAFEGVPGAKDMPVFGSLFRSRDFLNNETELVIIVTPYLVDATDPDKLKTPGDGYMNASDLAGFLSGRLNAVYKGGAAPDGKRLQGPAGHVID